MLIGMSDTTSEDAVLLPEDNKAVVLARLASRVTESFNVAELSFERASELYFILDRALEAIWAVYSVELMTVMAHRACESELNGPTRDHT